MTQQVKLWSIGPEGKLQNLPQTRLDLESRLEDWIEADVALVDEELLVIGRQINSDFGGFIDLLCIDANGDLVILELKRDKTPRQITAQALDYASWIVDLSHEHVIKIANDYFSEKGGFEDAFRKCFGTEIPETINNSHRILIIASAIDPSSERIIEYLSRHHGVNINAVTFQYFSSPAEGELLARVFLLEPEEVEYKARTKGGSKRQPNLSYEELQEAAEAHGVGLIYQEAVDLFRPYFDQARTTRTSISFKGEFRGSIGAMLNLIPEKSSTDKGLKFQIYSLRVAERFGVDGESIQKAMPEGIQSWEYYAEAPPNYQGFTGHFSSNDEIRQLVKVMSQAKGDKAV